MNNYFDYRCECGQYFGKDLYMSRYICGLCNTYVMRRSKPLPEYVKPTNIVDLVYENNTSFQSFIKELHINLLQFRLIELSNNILIYYEDTFFMVKNRRPICDVNGNIDINATHKDIMQRTYYVVRSDNIDDIVEDLTKNTNIEIRDFVIKII